jgi:hypothetical protein
MNINPNDLKAYTKFIALRGRRADMGPDFVLARIERLTQLVDDGASRSTPPEKMPLWKAELDEMKAVARVMLATAMEEGE